MVRMAERGREICARRATTLASIIGNASLPNARKACVRGAVGSPALRCPQVSRLHHERTVVDSGFLDALAWPGSVPVDAFKRWGVTLRLRKAWLLGQLPRVEQDSQQNRPDQGCGHRILEHSLIVQAPGDCVFRP